MNRPTDAVAVDAPDSQRLRVLRRSLARKEEAFIQRIAKHFDSVKAANGQPLNDKRNGSATLHQWERQNESLRRAQQGIEVTKSAIAREEAAVSRAAEVDVPAPIAERLADGSLTQWRKHPNTFFVAGVDKARIVLLESGDVAHRYVREVTDRDQYRLFARIYNELRAALSRATNGAQT